MRMRFLPVVVLKHTTTRQICQIFWRSLGSVKLPFHRVGALPHTHFFIHDMGFSWILLQSGPLCKGSDYIRVQRWDGSLDPSLRFSTRSFMFRFFKSGFYQILLSGIAPILGKSPGRYGALFQLAL
jgi:hypothetical protein